ncbi:hypothetical protein C8J56DRAFT_954370 [Mycena floridula]|nr:hypothetical protein C8J56DRAFT_954370 [Mycena floridula]
MQCPPTVSSMSDSVAASPAIDLERSLYWGQLLMTWLYGMDVFMFLFSCFHLNSKSSETRRAHRLYLWFGGLILVLLTIVVLTDAVFLQFMWIDHRNAPGGPIGYMDANSAIWFQTVGTGANQLTNFMGDGLLLYRCFIIWNGRWLVIVLPGLIYLASISMAIVMLVQSAIPGSQFFLGKTVDFGVVWAALTVSFNVTITGIITLRILKARRLARSVKNAPAIYTNIYTSFAAILIESSLPFTVLGIVFAVSYGKHLAEAPALLFVWAAFSALSPQFIIFRVAVGRAWTRKIASDASYPDRFPRKNPSSFAMSTFVTSGHFIDSFGDGQVSTELRPVAKVVP